jgi:hypothetical protein
MANYEKLTNDLIGLAIFVMIAITLIAVVYNYAVSIIGTVPAQVGVIIMGIVMAFIYAVDKNVRKTINSLVKKARK